MHPSAAKVAAAARQLGLDIEIVEFAETTRTAVDAANAIGCTVGQIVKSLCFLANGRPVMALVSGDNQLDERKLADLEGISRKKVRQASADDVKAATGFTIGGVPPFGHTTDLPIYIDQDLIRHETIWAAAGTPFAVFEVTPAELVAASGAVTAELKK